MVIDMDLLQLRYFCKIARLEHITRAAEELHVSQPALSKTLKLLEQELGTELFDRTGKFIRLNNYGRVFLKYAEQSLEALENGKRELADMSSGQAGDIRLAFPVGSHVVPALLSRFRQQYPDITFTLIQHFGPSDPPRFDLCISSLPLQIPRVESLPLLTEELFLAVPADHKLAGKTSIRLEDAAEEHFVTLRAGNDLRERTDSLCRIAGFNPKRIFESDDPATVRGLIRAGLGIALVPAVSWDGSVGEHVRLIRIEQPVCERTIGISWLEDHYLSKACLIFREFTVAYFRELALADAPGDSSL